MIGGVIDTFRITTQAVNQKFVQIKLRQVTVTGSSTRKIDMPIIFFSNDAILLPIVEKISTKKRQK